MECLEVSGAVRLIYRWLGVKGLNTLLDKVKVRLGFIYNRLRGELYINENRLAASHVYLSALMNCTDLSLL